MAACDEHTSKSYSINDNKTYHNIRIAMSFIEFESGWEKEKARQELREARAELLKRVMYLRNIFFDVNVVLKLIYLYRQRRMQNAEMKKSSRESSAVRTNGCCHQFQRK